MSKIKNKKAEDTRTGLIISIVLVVFVLVILLIYISTSGKGTLIDKINAIFPNFNLTSGEAEEIQLVGYNIGQDEPKWYDGTSWQDFQKNEEGNYNKNIKFQDKEVSGGNVRFYFEKYYYDESKRNNELKSVQTSSPFFETKIIDIHNPTQEKGKNGEVRILYELKSPPNPLYQKTITVIRAYSDDFETFCFRFVIHWEAADCLDLAANENSWKRVDEIKSDLFLPNKEMVRIIRELKGKDFSSGVLVLLSGDENYNYQNPENNIFTVGVHRLLSQEFPYRKNIFFRYVQEWEWSKDKNNWKKVSEPIESNNLGSDELAIIGSLIGKNFDSGINYLFITEKDKFVSSESKLEFILTIDNKLLEDGEEKQTTEVISQIKAGATTWRDSILVHSMPIKFSGLDQPFYYFCVRKYQIKESALLVVDLSKPVSQGATCPKS